MIICVVSSPEDVDVVQTELKPSEWRISGETELASLTQGLSGPLNRLNMTVRVQQVNKMNSHSITHDRAEGNALSQQTSAQKKIDLLSSVIAITKQSLRKKHVIFFKLNSEWRELSWETQII